MTTKTDAARECAEELNKQAIINGSDIGRTAAYIRKHFPPSVPTKKWGSVVDAARHAANGIPWGDGTPEERLKRRQEYQDRIADAFHDFVPVSKLERLLKLSDVFVWNTANWTTAIRNLIAK